MQNVCVFSIFSWTELQFFCHFVYLHLSISYPVLLTLFAVAVILNTSPSSLETRDLLCARVFSQAAAILESKKTLGTGLHPPCLPNRLYTRGLNEASNLNVTVFKRQTHQKVQNYSVIQFTASFTHVVVIYVWLSWSSYLSLFCKSASIIHKSCACWRGL